MVRRVPGPVVPFAGELELHRSAEQTGELVQRTQAGAELQTPAEPCPLPVAAERFQELPPGERQPVADLRVDTGRVEADALTRKLEVVLPQRVGSHPRGTPGGSDRQRQTGLVGARPHTCGEAQSVVGVAGRGVQDEAAALCLHLQAAAAQPHPARHLEPYPGLARAIVVPGAHGAERRQLHPPRPVQLLGELDTAPQAPHPGAERVDGVVSFSGREPRRGSLAAQADPQSASHRREPPPAFEEPQGQA